MDSVIASLSKVEQFGGIVERVMRPSRKVQARAQGEQDRLERIREDFRRLSDTMLEHSVRGGRGVARYPFSEKIATIRQMVGGLDHEAPTLRSFRHPISNHFDQSQHIQPDWARQLLDPVSREVLELLNGKTR